MRQNWLLGAAALIAIAAPAVAHADTTGYVGLGYATLDDNDDGDKESYTTLNGGVVTDIGGDWHVQFDAADGSMDHHGHDDAQSNATVHAFYRNSTFAVGGFGGFQSRTGSSHWDIGAEGQVYLGNFTLGGDYTHADVRNGGYYQTDSVDVIGDYFIMPNLSVGGGITWRSDEWEGEDAFVYQANVEYQFSGSPFSVGAAYWQADADYDSSGGHDTNSFGVFARWNFGTPDLITRNHEGASMPGGSNFVRDVIGAY
jgi:Gram-negative porin